MADDGDARIRLFNTPRRLEKTMHTLEGILRGITMDGRVDDQELIVLADWLGEHSEFRNKHPFTEIIPRIERIIAEEIVDEEERADCLWLCSQFTTGSQHFDPITSDLQVLHGIMGGIAADSRISVAELRSLSEWIEGKEHLYGCWPFDEVSSLVTGVLSDGRIDANEHETLLHFFADVLAFLNHKSLGKATTDVTPFRSGICAVQPQIVISERRFCFTGTPRKGPKRLLQEAVVSRNGIVEKNVVNALDYLIIGAEGNECWAYSAYGRKVETAIERRKAGSKLLIVHEFDFWEALQ
ncbi:MAG: NAD-dependent DNA ligase [Planctomycetaceae bacterium]